MKRNPWASHYQHGYMAKALDRRWRSPLWLRVAYLAYARHEANGHANFEPGEIASILGCKDPSNLSHAISNAVKLDYLDMESCAACLVVPPYLVFGLGNPQSPCECHAQKLLNRKKSTNPNRIDSNQLEVDSC